MRKLQAVVEARKGQVAIWPGAGALSRAHRFVDGGKTRFLEYVTLAAQDGDVLAAQFLTGWQALTPTEQLRIHLDDVCAATGVSPSNLMGVVVATGMRHESDVADLTASAIHPRIVRQTAKSALRIGGKYADIAQKDRHALLTHQHFLPVPKSASFSVNVNANANAKAAAVAATEPSVPSFFEDMGSLQEPKEQIQRILIGGVVDEDSDEQGD